MQMKRLYFSNVHLNRKNIILTLHISLKYDKHKWGQNFMIL